MILILSLLIYNIKLDYQNYLKNKKIKIFLMFKEYFLKKCAIFFIWKNTSFTLFLLQVIYRKYIILSLINLIFISSGFYAFYLNIYDIYFFKFFDLTNPTYNALELPFSSFDVEASPQKNAEHRIQKEPLIYNFLFFTTCLYIIIIFYKK